MAPEIIPLFLAVLLVLGAWILYLWMNWQRDELTEIDTFQALLAEWADLTFCDWTLDGTLNHLKKEIEEARENPSDVSEFADLYMLLNQSASKAGHRMSTVLAASLIKHSENLEREWGPQLEDGSFEHRQH